ncbi:uncharacterized mitochondrial protein AtMg00810-like [Brassica napus]|uniref:uncharacterized mitochondrial protein AtMg00810-like n=1 Tax=Brassica oleracea var. oleracea TaxID=109376 RepID=UPI0006A6D1D5|nr:PREDICTED: uncharacterized mitochondrial protein AtMg00810-like [Brassica oleracea var. oleracea]XP_013689665.1 uncharacterized mitochondrial protein AtMg00810-like [Brassica napus]
MPTPTVHYFLGLQVHAHEDGLFLSQEKYTTDLLINAGMDECAPVLTPLPLQLDRKEACSDGCETNLKRVLRYLKGTHTFGINLSANTDITLQAFSDSDWAG